MGAGLRDLWNDWGERRECELILQYLVLIGCTEGQRRDHLLRYLWQMATVR
jgi:hypothetical protein